MDQSPVPSNNPAPRLRPVLSAKEAADLLGVSRSLVFRFLRDGTLDRIKIGNRTLIRRAEVEALIS
jgi:excisionase family DNA binding protein